jgi:hypothetical protein
MTEKECAIVYKTASVKTVSAVAPVIDSDAEQVAACKEAIEMLSNQIRDVYDHQNRIAEIATESYRERLAERCHELALLQAPGCFGKPTETEMSRLCDNCSIGRECFAHADSKGCA